MTFQKKKNKIKENEALKRKNAMIKEDVRKILDETKKDAMKE